MRNIFIVLLIVFIGCGPIDQQPLPVKTAEPTMAKAKGRPCDPVPSVPDTVKTVDTLYVNVPKPYPVHDTLKVHDTLYLPEPYPVTDTIYKTTTEVRYDTVPKYIVDSTLIIEKDKQIKSLKDLIAENSNTLILVANQLNKYLNGYRK